MKKIIDSNQIKTLMIGVAMFGVISINSCAKQSSSNTNQTIANTTEINKAKAKPKSTPTVEVVEKTTNNSTIDIEENSSKLTSENKPPTEAKSKGKLDTKITKENYDQINIGMTHGEVTKIFDDKGMQTSEMHVNGHDMDMFMWSTDNFSKRITVTFEKDKVTEKKQNGL